MSFLIVTCQEEYGRVRETAESDLEFGKHGLFKRMDCVYLKKKKKGGMTVFMCVQDC